MDHTDWIPICATERLLDQGKGVRFALLAGGIEATGFVVRFKGTVFGYLNRCAHVPIELDWAEGEFFESSGLYLMCSTHGAIYAPENGRCQGGPCRGGKLRQIVVSEFDNQIFWRPDDFLTAIATPPGTILKENQ